MLNIRGIAVVIVIMLVFDAITAKSQTNVYKDWGPPYCVIYGGYSAESDADWDMWDGVFNLVHHSLIGRDEKEVEHILSLARRHKMKILTTVWLYDFKKNKIDEEAVAKFKKFYEVFGCREEIFGYGFEAAYRIPRDKQLEIYRIIKSIDPSRPVWMEFSSTSTTTWKRGFNPDACDGIYPYLYPYETKDKDENLIGRTKRILYPIPAINELKRKGTVVVPIIQAFMGGSWNKLPPKGSIMMQFRYWLNVNDMVGVGFYRWRSRGIYKGIPEIPGGDYVWEEVKELCKGLLSGNIKIDKSFAIKAGNENKLKLSEVKSEVNTVSELRFEIKEIFIDQDFEDIALNTSPPKSDWDIRNTGLVVLPVKVGYPVGYRILKLFDKYPVIARSLPKWDGDVKLSFWVKPTEPGYGKGMVYLETFGHPGYVAAGLRLGHGSGANSNVFSYLNKDGRWVSTGVRWKPDTWYRVEMIFGKDKIIYNFFDIRSSRLNSSGIITPRRFKGSYKGIYFSCDHSADKGVYFDKIELCAGYLK